MSPGLFYTSSTPTGCTRLTSVAGERTRDDPEATHEFLISRRDLLGLDDDQALEHIGKLRQTPEGCESLSTPSRGYPGRSRAPRPRGGSQSPHGLPPDDAGWRPHARGAASGERVAERKGCVLAGSPDDHDRHAGKREKLSHPNGVVCPPVSSGSPTALLARGLVVSSSVT